MRGRADRRTNSGARLMAAGLLLFLVGCPRSPTADIELTERLTVLEDAMVQLDQENADLATRLERLEAQLSRQDTVLTRMSRMLDEMAFAIERR